jgi:cytochrome b
MLAHRLDRMSPESELRSARVWDLPTRAFHWLLAATVVASIVSAKIGGNAMAWHMRFGLLAMALLLFRLAWGFVGGRWSRFTSFVYGPRQVLEYLRGGSGPAGRYDIGHSPLGSLSVFALLALLVCQVATGLVADDEIATLGPLNRFVEPTLGLKATGWHESFGQYLIIAMVVLHVSAVAYYVLRKRRNLIGAMWHGDQPVAAGTPASADGLPQRALALALFAAAAALAGWIGSLG